MGLIRTIKYILMEKFRIAVSRADEHLEFDVLNKRTERCEYEVCSGEVLVAVFEPDEDEYIHVSRNQGGLDEEVIYLIADRIEAQHL
jgi:hypothetical protein